MLLARIIQDLLLRSQVSRSKTLIQENGCATGWCLDHLLIVIQLRQSDLLPRNSRWHSIELSSYVVEVHNHIGQRCVTTLHALHREFDGNAKMGGEFSQISIKLFLQ